jgi:predicted DNA-binding transcriptional regulator AlpA
MSKEQACNYLNLSRSRFDDLVRERKIPRGKKRVGFKELYWYQDELDFCKKDR